MTMLIAGVMVVWGVTVLLWIGLSRQRGFLRQLQRAVIALLMTAGSLFLTALLIALQALHAFSGERLVAHVITRRLSNDAFELIYNETDHGFLLPPIAHTMTLRGDQWTISGGIVKWHPWLTAVGVPSYHKPRALSGQFANVLRQQGELSSIYPLEPQADLSWEILYRLQRWLPFIEAAYGSSAYVYVDPGIEHDIYVTPFGYMIKPTPR